MTRSASVWRLDLSTVEVNTRAMRVSVHFVESAGTGGNQPCAQHVRPQVGDASRLPRRPDQ